MKKSLQLIGRSILTFLGIAFCMLSVWGCGDSKKTNTESEEVAKNGVPASTEQFDRYDLELEYNAYEKVYSTELEIESEKIPLEIWNSNVGYRVIKIGDQEIPYGHREIPLGGAGLETMAYDVTGDGKEEIVFVEPSGANEYILVFVNGDRQWEELEIPSNIYSETMDSEFLKKQMEELDIELDDEVYVEGRTFSFQEEKVLINYWLLEDTDSGPIDRGSIQKELFYSSGEKKFLLGNILYIPAEN